MQEEIREERLRLVEVAKGKNELKPYLAYVQTAISNVVKGVKKDTEKKEEIEEKVEKWNKKPPLKIQIELIVSFFFCSTGTNLFSLEIPITPPRESFPNSIDLWRMSTRTWQCV